MVHELVEISQLKHEGRKIDKKVIVETPKILIYKAPLTAMEIEFKYALQKRDTFYAKFRLRQYKESVLDDDPNLPPELRSRAQEIFVKYSGLIKEASEKPIKLS